MRQREILTVMSFKFSPIEKKILDDLTQQLGVGYTDIIKMALWNYASSDKVINETLKELARAKKDDHRMDVLKELEYINNKRAFFIDGFRTSLSNYHSKHVPIENIERFVTLKLIGIYSLYQSNQRKEYLGYIKEHFVHFYPQKKRWLQEQIKIVRSMKKDEKEKLLASKTKSISARPMQEMQKLDRTLPVRE